MTSKPSLKLLYALYDDPNHIWLLRMFEPFTLEPLFHQLTKKFPNHNFFLSYQLPSGKQIQVTTDDDFHVFISLSEEKETEVLLVKKTQILSSHQNTSPPLPSPLEMKETQQDSSTSSPLPISLSVILEATLESLPCDFFQDTNSPSSRPLIDAVFQTKEWNVNGTMDSYVKPLCFIPQTFSKHAAIYVDLPSFPINRDDISHFVLALSDHARLYGCTTIRKIVFMVDLAIPLDKEFRNDLASFYSEVVEVNVVKKIITPNQDKNLEIEVLDSASYDKLDRLHQVESGDHVVLASSRPSLFVPFMRGFLNMKCTISLVHNYQMTFDESLITDPTLYAIQSIPISLFLITQIYIVSLLTRDYIPYLSLSLYQSPYLFYGNELDRIHPNPIHIFPNQNDVFSVKTKMLELHLDIPSFFDSFVCVSSLQQLPVWQKRLKQQQEELLMTVSSKRNKNSKNSFTHSCPATLLNITECCYYPVLTQLEKWCKKSLYLHQWMFQLQKYRLSRCELQHNIIQHQTTHTDSPILWTPSGYITQSTSVIILIDWQNIHTSTKYIRAFITSIREYVKNLHRQNNKFELPILTVKVFLDRVKLSDVVKEMSSLNVDIVHVDVSKQNAADSVVSRQMREYSRNECIVLVSGDRDFQPDLTRLTSKGHRVLLIHNRQAWKTFQQCALWESHCDYIDLPGLSDLKQAQEENRKAKSLSKQKQIAENLKLNVDNLIFKSGQLNFPISRASGLCMDTAPNSNALFICDSNRCCIYWLDLDTPVGGLPELKLFAGQPLGDIGQLPSQPKDGLVLKEASLRFPRHMIMDPYDHSILIADYGSKQIRCIRRDLNNPGSEPRMYSLLYPSSRDGNVLGHPSYLCLDQNRRLWVSDCKHHRLFYIDLNEKVDLNLELKRDINGTPLLFDSSNHDLKPRYSLHYVCGHASGWGEAPRFEGLVGEVDIGQPQGMALDPLGNLVFSDSLYGTIRRIRTEGIRDHRQFTVEVLCARPNSIVSQVLSNALVSVLINDPRALCSDMDGSILFTDCGTHQLKRLIFNNSEEDGGGEKVNVMIVAGKGQGGMTNGLAEDARFNQPLFMCVESKTNNIYVSDTKNSKVRVVSSLNRLPSCNLSLRHKCCSKFNDGNCDFQLEPHKCPFLHFCRACGGPHSEKQYHNQKDEYEQTFDCHISSYSPSSNVPPPHFLIQNPSDLYDDSLANHPGIDMPEDQTIETPPIIKPIATKPVVHFKSIDESTQNVQPAHHPPKTHNIQPKPSAMRHYGLKLNFNKAKMNEYHENPQHFKDDISSNFYSCGDIISIIIHDAGYGFVNFPTLTQLWTAYDCTIDPLMSQLNHYRANVPTVARPDQYVRFQRKAKATFASDGMYLSSTHDSHISHTVVEPFSYFLKQETTENKNNSFSQQQMQQPTKQEINQPQHVCCDSRRPYYILYGSQNVIQQLLYFNQYAPHFLSTLEKDSSTRPTMGLVNLFDFYIYCRKTGVIPDMIQDGLIIQTSPCRQDITLRVVYKKHEYRPYCNPRDWALFNKDELENKEQGESPIVHFFGALQYHQDSGTKKTREQLYQDMEASYMVVRIWGSGRKRDFCLPYTHCDWNKVRSEYNNRILTSREITPHRAIRDIFQYDYGPNIFPQPLSRESVQCAKCRSFNDQCNCATFPIKDPHKPFHPQLDISLFMIQADRIAHLINHPIY
jgi:hypothetical protein